MTKKFIYHHLLLHADQVFLCVKNTECISFLIEGNNSCEIIKVTVKSFIII